MRRRRSRALGGCCDGACLWGCLGVWRIWKSASGVYSWRNDESLGDASCSGGKQWPGCLYRMGYKCEGYSVHGAEKHCQSCMSEGRDGQLLPSQHSSEIYFIPCSKMCRGRACRSMERLANNSRCWVTRVFVFGVESQAPGRLVVVAAECENGTLAADTVVVRNCVSGCSFLIFEKVRSRRLGSSSCTCLAADLQFTKGL